MSSRKLRWFVFAKKIVNWTNLAPWKLKSTPVEILSWTWIRAISFKWKLKQNVKWGVKLFMTVFQLEYRLTTTDYCSQNEVKKRFFIIRRAVVNSININTVKVLFFYQRSDCLRNPTSVRNPEYHINAALSLNAINREKLSNCVHPHI